MSSAPSTVPLMGPLVGILHVPKHGAQSYRYVLQVWELLAKLRFLECLSRLHGHPHLQDFLFCDEGGQAQPLWKEISLLPASVLGCDEFLHHIKKLS